jgi:adenosylcobinamide-GDP ribazoletransferase
MGQALLIAVQFLTRIPVPLRAEVSEQAIGRSLLFYPVVGLLIGGLLVLLAWALDGIDTNVQAVVLLGAWVIITGGLHLDGLADSADAWLGGGHDSERTLAIMKDPYCGPAGVIALVLVLLAKFAIISAMLSQHYWLGLLAAPIMARTVVPILLMTTPYVREGGLGSPLVAHCPRQGMWGVSALVVLALLITFKMSAVFLLLNVVLLFFFLRYVMMQRIGGTTGDTAGAILEITEVAVLLVFATLLPE